ncbi:MAG TPA: response regulator [Anaerolineales bacterium]|nr:response regulator [Anaerolineales bacterium]
MQFCHLQWGEIKNKIQGMQIPIGPILVVEDVPNILELLEVTLRFKGYPVLTAKNGEEAMQLVNQERPALIITDLMMPKLDGFAMVQNLRSNPLTRWIPIIVLSATYVTPEDKAFVMKMGVARFLEKPVDTEKFLFTVQEILTTGPATLPEPLSEQEFFKGYRERLENKLRQKLAQIQRTELMMSTLSADQQVAFQAFLEDANLQRQQIQAELDDLYHLMQSYSIDA